MSAPQHQPSLNALQQMVNEVLVQTGKILKASIKGSKGNKEQVIDRGRQKLKLLHEGFNTTLDDLEADIIKAKSVFMRDLEALQAKNKTPEAVPAPQPVSAVPAAPMVIDLDPIKAEDSPVPTKGLSVSPSVSTKSAPRAESKPMAPFPNMGIEMPNVSRPGAKVKDEKRSPQPPAKPSPVPAKAPTSINPPKQPTKAAQPAPVPAPAAVPEAAMQNTFDLTGADETSALGGMNPELNFTDMMFSLAPPSDSHPTNTQSQDQTFDLTNFGDSGVNDSMNSLEPSNAALPGSAEAPQMDPVAPAPTTGPSAAAEDGGKKAVPEKALEAPTDDFYDLDGAGGGMVNMDMDLDLNNEGVGLGDDSNFNDLFYEDTDMGETKFDEAFFGL